MRRLINEMGKAVHTFPQGVRSARVLRSSNETPNSLCSVNCQRSCGVQHHERADCDLYWMHSITDERPLFFDALPTDSFLPLDCCASDVHFESEMRHEQNKIYYLDKYICKYQKYVLLDFC